MPVSGDLPTKHKVDCYASASGSSRSKDHGRWRNRIPEDDSAGESKMTKVEELLEQARALPQESQVALYDALHNLISPLEPEWEAAWSEECKRRRIQIERGEVQPEE